MNCECVKKMDAQLAPNNARVATGLSISNDLSEMKCRVLIAVERVAPSRRPLPHVVASYCPFCGAKA